MSLEVRLKVVLARGAGERFAKPGACLLKVCGIAAQRTISVAAIPSTVWLPTVLASR